MFRLLLLSSLLSCASAIEESPVVDDAVVGDSDGALEQVEPRSISILGDSYSTFEGAVSPSDNAVWYFVDSQSDKTDVAQVEQTWWSLLCAEEQYCLEQNNSFSGSTICNTGYNGNDVTVSSFMTRAANLGDPDIILIFGATNDSWAGVPIGEFVYDDWSAEELFTFRPATAYLLDFLKANHPDATLCFMINDSLKSEVDSSIITICDYYNVDYIELSAIDKLTGHPSIAGMKQIYSQLLDFLE